jgi:hypothetical protein
MFAGTRKFTRYRHILAISALVLGGLHCTIIFLLVSSNTLETWSLQNKMLKCSLLDYKKIYIIKNKNYKKGKKKAKKKKTTTTKARDV